MGDRRGVYRVLIGKPEGKRDHLENPGVDGRIILRCIVKRYGGEAWSRLTWLRIGTGGGHL
jgi:hypothetical protein